MSVVGRGKNQTHENARLGRLTPWPISYLVLHTPGACHRPERPAGPPEGTHAHPVGRVPLEFLILGDAARRAFSVRVGQHARLGADPRRRPGPDPLRDAPSAVLGT